MNWSWEQRTLEYKECTVEQEPLLTTMTLHGSAACSSLYHSSAVDLCAHPSRGGQLQQEHSFSFLLVRENPETCIFWGKSRRLGSLQGLRDTLIQ